MTPLKPSEPTSKILALYQLLLVTNHTVYLARYVLPYHLATATPLSVTCHYETLLLETSVHLIVQYLSGPVSATVSGRAVQPPGANRKLTPGVKKIKISQIRQSFPVFGNVFNREPGE